MSFNFSGFASGVRTALRRFSSGYVERYPDVLNFRFPPFVHWLIYGWREKRHYFPSLIVSRKTLGVELSLIHKVNSASYPIDFENLIAELDFQANLEPMLPNSSLRDLGATPVYEAWSLTARTGISSQKITEFVGQTFSTVVVMPSVVIGGAEKYMSNLAREVSEDNPLSVLIVLTEEGGLHSDVDLPAEIKWLNECNTLYWTSSGGFPANPELLARFLRSLNTPQILVCNSDLGFQTVSRFGLGLGQSAQITPVMFSFGPPGALSYARIFARQLSSQFSILTDNSRFVRDLNVFTGSTRTISPQILPSLCESVAEASTIKPTPPQKKRSSIKWLWFSRLSWDKAPELLVEIAKRRPREEFHVYGPSGPREITDLFASVSNIHVWGPVCDLGELPLDEFSGYVFTSRFEGLPNTVLEAALSRLPLIVSDVGGIRDSLDEGHCFLIPVDGSDSEQAMSFDRCMQTLLDMDSRDLKDMVQNAFTSVHSRHSQLAFKARVKELMREKR